MKAKFPNTDLLLKHSDCNGLFGPNSYRWQYFGYRSHRLAILSASILQIAHPVIAKAVGQTEAFQTQPLQRGLAVVKFLRDITYGKPDTVIRAAENLWTIHSNIEIKYSNDVYFATEAKLLRWVWMTSIVMNAKFMPISVNLDGFNANKSYEESKLIALACGVSTRDIPDSLPEFNKTYEDFYAKEIHITATARKIAESVFILPSEITAELTSKQWSKQFDFLINPFNYYCYLFSKALLPDRVREELGIEFNKAEQQRFHRWCKRLKWFNGNMPNKLCKSRTNLQAYSGILL